MPSGVPPTAGLDGGPLGDNVRAAFRAFGMYSTKVSPCVMSSEPYTEAETGQVMVGHTSFQAPDQLVQRLRAKGYRDDELVDAGLARRVASRLGGSEPVVYDFYQAQVLLPVRDQDEDVIELIGRYNGNHVADKRPK
jgi:hypothetical protein